MTKRSSIDPRDLLDAFEHLREGTREQFESDWVSIVEPDGEDIAVTFTHRLGEIPWAVDVLQSDASDGSNPAEADLSAADMTVTKDATEITLTRSTSSTAGDLYFKVRAL